MGTVSSFKGGGCSIPWHCSMKKVPPGPYFIEEAIHSRGIGYMHHLKIVTKYNLFSRNREKKDIGKKLNLIKTDNAWILSPWRIIYIFVLAFSVEVQVRALLSYIYRNFMWLLVQHKYKPPCWCHCIVSRAASPDFSMEWLLSCRW